MSVSTKHEVGSVLKQHGRYRSGRHSGGSSWASRAEAAGVACVLCDEKMHAASADASPD